MYANDSRALLTDGYKDKRERERDETHIKLYTETLMGKYTTTAQFSIFACHYQLIVENKRETKNVGTTGRPLQPQRAIKIIIRKKEREKQKTFNELL